jgi:hypothetical protein
MRSLASLTILMSLMLGCNAPAPVANEAAPAATAPAPSQDVAPAPGTEPAAPAAPAEPGVPEVLEATIEPLAPVAPLAKGGATPTDFEICTHVMEVTKREYGDSARKPSDEEVAKYREECLAEIGKERERLGAEKFAVQVACVMAGTKMEELMMCGSP